MIIEKVDPGSGAILFKKSKESKDLEKALQKIESLEQRVNELEKMIIQLINNKA